MWASRPAGRNHASRLISSSPACTTGVKPTAAGLVRFAYNINFAPPSSAGNRFNTIARHTGVMNDIGTRGVDVTSNAARFLAGVKYSFAWGDGDIATTYSKNKVEQASYNGLTLTGTCRVFGLPSTSQPPVPTSTASTYITIATPRIKDNPKVPVDLLVYNSRPASEWRRSNILL